MDPITISSPVTVTDGADVDGEVDMRSFAPRCHFAGLAVAFVIFAC
jgi:hypothetical protein